MDKRGIKMQIENKNIEEIIPYENNPRNNDEAAEYVAKSIKEFGFKNPIIIDKNNVIVAGHTRLKAAKQLGLKTVPCICADDLTEEQIKAFRLADNKVGEIATWDYEKLNIELEDINIDMSDFGFSLDFEDNVFENINDEGLEETAGFEHKMKIDNTQIILTEDEYKQIMKLLNDYLNKNGVSFGFVSYLVGDKIG